MNKKTAKKCTGSLLAGLLLATIPTMMAGAESRTATTHQSSELSSLQHDLARLNETIFLKLQELTKQGIRLTQLQVEYQNMLTSMPTDVQQRGQTSMSLRDFYGSEIFSCRGFA